MGPTTAPMPGKYTGDEMIQSGSVVESRGYCSREIVSVGGGLPPGMQVTSRMSDLTRLLRALSRHEHNDHSLGDDAADEIEELREFVDEVAKGPYRDSDLGSYCESLTARARALVGEGE